MRQFSQGFVNKLVDQQQETFVREALERLRAEFPALWLRVSEEQLSQSLRAECERAKAYHLCTGDGIYTLFTSRLRLGRQFPEGAEYAWARSLFGDIRRPEDERIRAFEAVLWGEQVGADE